MRFMCYPFLSIVVQLFSRRRCKSKEELPSDSALDVLPESVMGKMYQKLKLRARLVDPHLPQAHQAVLLSHALDTEAAAPR